MNDPEASLDALLYLTLVLPILLLFVVSMIEDNRLAIKLATVGQVIACAGLFFWLLVLVASFFVKGGGVGQGASFAGQQLLLR